MKQSIRKYILGFSLVIILVLLAAQVRWIVYSINLQDKVFRKSVTLALNQTIANLTENKGICTAMQKCIACKSGELKLELTSAGVWEKIHRSIDEELKSYDIEIDYDLFIVETGSDYLKSIEKKIMKGSYYSQYLNDVIGKEGYKLVVQFPGRTKFFMKKVGLMFLSSVLLIFLLIASIVYLFKIYKQQLQVAEHTKEFLNNVSHEFKTPLSSIALAANMIKKKRYSDEEKLLNFAGLISKENKKLELLVESLLHLAAIERNEFDYSKEEISAHDIIEDSISTVAIILHEKGGEIKTDFKAENDVVFADKLHLGNVIVNLLSNAIKYSKELPEIKISTKTIENAILIDVVDNGLGIQPKYKKYIFDKYYRVPTGNVHNEKGFGIGLAYVKKVVEAHGGEVQVESEWNIGTTFKIWLPLNI